MAQPHPGQFDHGRTGFRIAGLADALVAIVDPLEYGLGVSLT